MINGRCSSEAEVLSFQKDMLVKTIDEMKVRERERRERSQNSAHHPDKKLLCLRLNEERKRDESKVLMLMQDLEVSYSSFCPTSPCFNYWGARNNSATLASTAA